MDFEFVYYATALCHIGDFQGGECLIYLSVTSITVCAQNGRAVGSWPYNIIRDFSCRDRNFSFTSGRRGPFGIGMYQFQLTPPALTKLASTITAITGAQFGPKQQESKSSKAATSSDSLIQPWISSAGQHCAASISSNSSLLPQPLTDDAHSNGITKPLHSYRSLPELRSSGIVHSSRPHLLKKQMSSPGPAMQRPCHQYEEIDPPNEAIGLPPSSSCAFASSTNSNSTSGVALPHLSPPVGTVHTLHNATSPSGVVVPFSLTVTEKRSSGGYENIQNGRERKRQNVNNTAGCCHPKSLHKASMQKPVVPDKAAGVYDCPRQALYSVPTCSRGEVLTLKARDGCAQVPPLVLSKMNVTDTLHCSVQSSKVQRQHSSKDACDGDLYEEIDLAGGCPSQSSGHHQNSLSGQQSFRCGAACNAVASMIAQQLATEEGYELITSVRHVVSDHCSLSDAGQRGSEQCYINQNVISVSHPDAE